MPNGYTTSQRAFSVSVSGIDGEFSTFSGGEKTKSTSKAWNGGAQVPDIVASPPEVGNITVGRPYNPRRDQPVIEQMRRRIGRNDERFTVRKQPLDGNDTPVGKAETYTGCVLVGVTAPDYDRGSSTPAQMQLQFEPQSVV